MGDSETNSFSVQVGLVAWGVMMTLAVVLNTLELASRTPIIEENQNSVRVLLIDNIDLRKQLREQNVLKPRGKSE